MQISTQSRKRLLFAALCLAILVPLFFTLEIRSQLPLLGFEGGSHLITGYIRIRLAAVSCGK